MSLLPSTARTAFVHVGTHKTGTTSIQALLAANDSALRGAGVFVPRSGRIDDAYAGHHNIAWELGADRRFDPAHGTLDTLVAEIMAANAPTVCLSSEDFESLHGNEHALRLLRDALNAAGYAVTIVLYLRPQADYLESLYAEICPCWNVAFGAFLDGIIAAGGYGGTLFDYDRLTTAFADVFGADRLVVRAYRAADPAALLLHAFVRIVNRGRDLPNPVMPTRLNAMRSFANVIAARTRIAGGSRHEPIAPGQPFDPLGIADIALLAARFSLSNERVARRYGIALTAATGAILVRELLTEILCDRDGRYRKHLIRSLVATDPVAIA
jgi:hypothetical protein